MYSLLSQVLEIGRPFKITCLMTNHLPSSRNDTRRINKCHIFVYFQDLAVVKSVLKEYIGFDKKTNL